jgi:hypothetical protein
MKALCRSKAFHFQRAKHKKNRSDNQLVQGLLSRHTAESLPEAARIYPVSGQEKRGTECLLHCPDVG